MGILTDCGGCWGMLGSVGLGFIGGGVMFVFGGIEGIGLFIVLSVCCRVIFLVFWVVCIVVWGGAGGGFLFILGCWGCCCCGIVIVTGEGDGWDVICVVFGVVVVFCIIVIRFRNICVCWSRCWSCCCFSFCLICI